MFERENDGQILFRAANTTTGTAVDRLPRQENSGGIGPVKVNSSKFLDSPQALNLHDTMFGHYFRELDRQQEQRLLMARDEDFRDHEQYTPEELEILADRGQVPLTYNLIQSTVNWVTGTERRSKKDYRILPRRKDGLKAAEHKTELMKHLADVNDSRYHYSRAFLDQVSVGLGWIETGHIADYLGGEPVYDRSETWRNMLWDSTAMSHDLEDARYLFRTKWVDIDTAVSLFPTRQAVIENATSVVYESGTSLDGAGDEPMDYQEEEHFRNAGLSYSRYGSWGARDRVRLFECWFKKVVAEQFIRGGEFEGEVFDPWSPGHIDAINRGRASIIRQPRMRIMVAIFTTKGLLYLNASPYRHNRYPFTPLWGYRRASDNMPYGLIRGIIDPQRDFNKRASKALHIMSSSQILMEEGSVTDEDELRDEAARPDGIIKYKMGRQPPQKITDTNLAAAHLQFAEMDMRLIQMVGGVTDENLGRDTNAQSGRAIIAKQDQGQLTTSVFFDNAALARKIHGGKLLTNIEQFYTEEKEFRITNERGNPEFRIINQDPADHIALTKADFIIEEEDWRATVRAAQAEMLLDLMSKLAATAPELVVNSIDLLIEALDVPKQGELVKRIRQLTGQLDPDADLENPDETTRAILEQKQRAAQMQERMAQAEIGEKEAKVMETLAKARNTIMQAAKTGQSLTTAELDHLQKAVQAAMELAAAPAVARVADSLLNEAIAKASQQVPQPPQQQQQITA